MKKSLLSALVILAVTTGANTALASRICGSFSQTGNKYTTSSGVVFNRVSIKSGGQGWQAPDGTIWSDDQGSFVQYGGSYSSTGDTIVNSPAAKVCQNIGGAIPTQQQYTRLLSYFPNLAPMVWGSYKPNDLAAQVAQSNQSYKDMTALFPQMAHGSFWISETCTDLARYDMDRYYDEETDSLPVIGGDLAFTIQLNPGDGSDDSPSQANMSCGTFVNTKLPVQCVITPQ